MEEEQEGLQQCLGDRQKELRGKLRQHACPEAVRDALIAWGSGEHMHELGQMRVIPYLFSEALLPSSELLWLLHASRSPEWAIHRVNQLVTRMCRVKCAD